MELVSKTNSYPVNTKPAAPLVDATSPMPIPERHDFALAGIIGAELSGQIRVMKDIVDEFTQTRKISRLQLNQLRHAIEVADRVARQSQQVSRLSEGRLRQSHERLHLDKVVESAVSERYALFHDLGIEVLRSIKPVEVIVDPGLLSSLVDAALDWGADLGQRLAVNLAVKNWPEHALLTVKATQSVVSDGTPAQDLSERGDGMNWQLLMQIGRAMGVSVQREVGPGEASVSIEFARTVRQLEGLTTMEIDTGEDSSMHSGSRPLAGHRLLLVTTDSMVRAEVQSAAGLLGLVVDTVATARQAVRCVEIDMPHMLILDERVRDEQLDNLILDLKRHNPNFGLLEVADDANTFAIASWMSDTNTRVSRDLLRTQLPSLLTLELAKSI